MQYTFMDFFCGAGGFSEGFRQQGFKSIRGFDMWQPAINTHNLNFNLNDEVFDILKFEQDEEIEKIENSHIILGSPPCVSFSLANKSGKADKSLGIRLIESFLRVVAIKKHQKNSILIAWFMENVPNSKNYVKEAYTFEDLNLSNWAKNNNIKPSDIALKVKNNGDVLTASNYGSPQKRERFICGEFIKSGKFPFPKKTHSPEEHITVGHIRKKLPNPYSKPNENTTLIDPNYPSLKIKETDLTDAFYDNGLYKFEWEKAKLSKVNHPFAGKMSFPENESKPSRTIMATRSGGTRESIIYKSEEARTGNGEYRLPTIREIATMMGFPLVFNFTGTESNKWRQVGNAVCPHMSGALAKSLRKELKLKEIKDKDISFDSLIENFKNSNSKFNNLNSSKLKVFDKVQKRKKDAKVRRHFYKEGNITISLMNYILNQKVKEDACWDINIFLGSGANYKLETLPYNSHTDIETYIKTNLNSSFLPFITEAKKLCKNVPNNIDLQKLYENYNSSTSDLDVDSFFKDGKNLLEKYFCLDLISQDFIKNKKEIPTIQLLSLFLLSLYTKNLNN